MKKKYIVGIILASLTIVLVIVAVGLFVHYNKPSSKVDETNTSELSYSDWEDKKSALIDSASSAESSEAIIKSELLQIEKIIDDLSVMNELTFPNSDECNTLTKTCSYLGYWYTDAYEQDVSNAGFSIIRTLLYGYDGNMDTYISNLKTNVELALKKYNEVETTIDYETPSNNPIVEYPAGQYKVGVDIPSGEYVCLATSGSGYFMVSSDSNGNDITYNSNFENNSIVTVYDGEYITLSRCIAVSFDEYHKEHVISHNKPGTMLKVGIDIQAGEYKLVCEENYSGYYAVFSSSRQDDIISNSNFENYSYVTVSDGQYLCFNRCYIMD